MAIQIETKAVIEVAVSEDGSIAVVDGAIVNVQDPKTGQVTKRSYANLMDTIAARLGVDKPPPVSRKKATEDTPLDLE